MFNKKFIYLGVLVIAIILLLLVVTSQITKKTDKSFLYSHNIFSNYSIVDVSLGEEKEVNCFLHEGNKNDLNKFSWQTENPDIIKIVPRKNKCTIKAQKEGITKIKCSNKNVNSTLTYNIVVKDGGLDYEN